MSAVERIPIGSRSEWLALRKPNIGASVAGCLLGVHEYQTAYGLWARLTGALAEDPEETPVMERGRLLEPVALTLLSEKRPTWKVAPNPVPGGVYLIDRAARLAATPDAFVIDPERGPGIVQVKSVEPGIFRRKWRDPETGETAPPLWIAVQSLVEADLAGASWAAVAALTVGYGLDLHVVDVPLHAGVVARVRAAVDAFWRMVEEGRRPDPDYARDAELIADLYAEDDGTTIDLRSDNRIVDLLAERTARQADRKAADDDLQQINAELFAKLGPAAAALTRDGVLTAKTIRRKSFTVPEGSYRRLAFKPYRNEDAA